jgi:hypothetical protein
VKKLIYILLLVATFQSTTSAQAGWELGGWAGVTYYFGDLNSNFRLNHPGIGFGAIGRYNFNERISLKFGANYGHIEASDSESPNPVEQRRNLNFRSVLFDGSAQLEFNFLPLIYSDESSRFAPYVFAGFNVFYFNPQGKHNGIWYDLRSLGTEGQFRGEEYYSVMGGLVYGGGLKIAIGETWAINLEISGRRLFTNYLDDVDGNYANKNEILRQRGPLAVALSDPSMSDANGKQIGVTGTQRGSGKHNDSYAFFGLGLVYYFGDLHCPNVSAR